MLKNESDIQIKVEKPFKEYKDYLYKKLKTKADGKWFTLWSTHYIDHKMSFFKIVLETQLESFEQEFIKNNEIGSLYNVSIATQVLWLWFKLILVLLWISYH